MWKSYGKNHRFGKWSTIKRCGGGVQNDVNVYKRVIPFLPILEGINIYKSSQRFWDEQKAGFWPLSLRWIWLVLGHPNSKSQVWAAQSRKLEFPHVLLTYHNLSQLITVEIWVGHTFSHPLCLNERFMHHSVVGRCEVKALASRTTTKISGGKHQSGAFPSINHRIPGNDIYIETKAKLGRLEHLKYWNENEKESVPNRIQITTWSTTWISKYWILQEPAKASHKVCSAFCRCVQRLECEKETAPLMVDPTKWMGNALGCCAHHGYSNQQELRMLTNLCGILSLIPTCVFWYRNKKIVRTRQANP